MCFCNSTSSELRQCEESECCSISTDSILLRELAVIFFNVQVVISRSMFFSTNPDSCFFYWNISSFYIVFQSMKNIFKFPPSSINLKEYLNGRNICAFLKKQSRTSRILSHNSKPVRIIFNLQAILKIFTLFYLLFLWISIESNEPKQPMVIRKVGLKKHDYWIGRILYCCDTIWIVELQCEKENIDRGRSYYDKGIDISDCFFSRTAQYIGFGGVIYISDVSKSMNISFSMFYHCFCSLGGGALYFYSYNSCLRMICANRCSCGTSYDGHFASIRATQVNRCDFLSVSYCSHTSDGRYSLYLNSGNQRVENTNSSMNHAFQCSGICFWTPSSLNSTHCTLSNNQVSNSICIYFSSCSGTISSSNILYNDSPVYGIAYVFNGRPKMNYCIFQNNQNNLFYIYSGSLEVSHSFIEHSSSLSANIAVSTSCNNSLTETTIYQIHFFNSLHCNADFPILTPRSTKTFGQNNLRSMYSFYQIIHILIS